MKILRASFATVTIVTMMSISANAQDDGAKAADAPPPPGGRPTFASFDADSDGKITLEEFEAAFVPRQMDGRAPPEPADVFGRWDANSDGVVTEEEMTDRPMGPPGGRPPGQ